MLRVRRPGQGDVLALLTLIGTALIVTYPILRGGYLTYLDNPVHLAEVYDLSRPGSNGWSEIGFAGFSLGTLHSPLFYGLLVALVRAGIPLEPMYAAALFVGFVAVPLAVYAVARARLAPARAAALSYVLLIQSPMIWGIGSPLGGMWTYGVASALVVFAAMLLARPLLSDKEVWWLAALVAVAVLTHLFMLPILALLAVVTTAVHVMDGRMTGREVRRRLLACLVAALASSSYWLTFVWVGSLDAPLVPGFAPLDILCRLFAPSDPMYLLHSEIRKAIRWDLHLTDAAPMVLLIAAGIAGFAIRRRERDALTKTGFWLALALFALLLVQRDHPMAVLGPVSWRFADWVRIGLSLSAIRLLDSPPRRAAPSPRRAGVVLAAVFGVLLGFWWRIPLEHDVAYNPANLRRVESLWAWLKTNVRDDWGRIYLGDAFGSDWGNGGLSHSHLLALTSHHVGVPQLGTYYGVIPNRLRWTLSEFDSLFGSQAPSAAWIIEASDKTNAGVIVTSTPEMELAVDDSDDYDPLYTVSRYTVWKRKVFQNTLTNELSPANHISKVVAKRGDVRFDLRTEYDGSRVLVKMGFHPWWRLEGVPAGTFLRESPEGFLILDKVPRGQFHVHMWYEPSRLPGLITAVGWAILGWFAFVLWRPTSTRESDQGAERA